MITNHNGQFTENFFSYIDRCTKQAILESIARHYGISADDAYIEVIDVEAESLLDYLVEPERSATSCLMQKYSATVLLNQIKLGARPL